MVPFDRRYVAFVVTTGFLLSYFFEEIFLSVQDVLLTVFECMFGELLEDEELTDDDVVPMYMISEYVDLLPSNQFTLLQLYYANAERNESTWIFDELLL